MEAKTQIDTYIASFPELVQERLNAVLTTIREANPKATLDWAYSMPAFRYRAKPLVYVAAYAGHVGVYALPHTHAEFAHRLSGFKQGKGSVQFPHDVDLPLDLIAEMVAHRSKNIDDGLN